jgi:hypothetical protein
LHQCRQAELASALPALIRDMHTSLAAGCDVAELLDVAVPMAACELPSFGGHQP